MVVIGGSQFVGQEGFADSVFLFLSPPSLFLEFVYRDFGTPPFQVQVGMFYDLGNDA